MAPAHRSIDTLSGMDMRPMVWCPRARRAKRRISHTPGTDTANVRGDIPCGIGTRNRLSSADGGTVGWMALIRLQGHTVGAVFQSAVVAVFNAGRRSVRRTGTGLLYLPPDPVD